MAQGILVSYAGYPYTLSSLFPDNGLASLAAVLRCEGHGCEVIDLNTVRTMERLVDRQSRQTLESIARRMLGGAGEEELRRLAAVEGQMARRGEQLADELGRRLAQRARELEADFVGFKLWNGDGYQASLRMAALLRRELPGLRLFAGGPSVHYCARQVVQEGAAFDAVIDGDGEEAILALARYAEGRGGLEQVPNLVLPGGELQRPRALDDLSCLPRPDYSPQVYPAVHGGEKLRLFCIDDSRGCPMRCAFCINWRIEGAQWRMRSAAQVVEEVRGFREELGSRAFRLAGTYSAPELVQGICDGLEAQGLEAQFGVSLHAVGATPQLLRALKRAGCFGVFIGVESGSAHVLKHGMHKSTTPRRLRQALSACMWAGLFTAGSFIYPAPFDTPESAAQTREMVEELFAGNPAASINLCFAGLLPRTDWWNKRSHYGFTLHVTEEAYVRRLLRYKIRHLVPPTCWEPLPYSLGGKEQPQLAQEAEEMQRWARAQGVTVNLADHDAQVGAALGYSAAQFQAILRHNVFVGDSEAMVELVQQANRALAP